MPSEFRTQRLVEWADTDKAGIVHFARFFVFMEQTEHEFWRALGLSVHMKRDENIISWPRLTADCEYFRPVSFEDTLDIHLQIEKKGGKSLSYRFNFHHNGKAVAEGRLKVACCICNPGEKIRAIAIPDFISDQLTQQIAETTAT